MNRIFKATILTGTCVLAWYLSVAAANLPAKVSKDATVCETVVFSDCGHQEKTEYPIPRQSAGLSPSEAAESLGANLIDYKNNTLTIQKEDSSCCLNHYRLILDGSTIKAEIIRTGEIKNEYPTAPAQFSENDLKLLKKGITADSEAELSSLIEDFTS